MLLGIVDFKGCYPQMAFCLKIWPHSNQSKPHVARSISNMKCMRLMDSPLLAMPKEIQRVKSFSWFDELSNYVLLLSKLYAFQILLYRSCKLEESEQDFVDHLPLDQQAPGQSFQWCCPQKPPPFPASIINVMVQGMRAVQILGWMWTPWMMHFRAFGTLSCRNPHELHPSGSLIWATDAVLIPVFFCNCWACNYKIDKQEPLTSEMEQEMDP